MLWVRFQILGAPMNDQRPSKQRCKHCGKEMTAPAYWEDGYAAAICNNRVHVDLCGYERAFAIRDRLKAEEDAEKST
jgi:hypothetical protein